MAAAVRSRRSLLARRPVPPLVPAPPLPRSHQQQRRRQRIWRWRLRTLDSRAPRRDVAPVPAPAVSRCSRAPSESSTGPSRATSTRAASAGSPRGFRHPTSTANSVNYPPVHRLRTREGSRRRRPSAQLRTRRASMSHRLRASEAPLLRARREGAAAAPFAGHARLRARLSSAAPHASPCLATPTEMRDQ